MNFHFLFRFFFFFFFFRNNNNKGLSLSLSALSRDDASALTDDALVLLFSRIDERIPSWKPRTSRVPLNRSFSSPPTTPSFRNERQRGRTAQEQAGPHYQLPLLCAFCAPFFFFSSPPLRCDWLLAGLFLHFPSSCFFGTRH